MQAKISRKRRKKATKIQPPDAENRMSGGVGEVTGAIPLPRPDQTIFVESLNSYVKLQLDQG
jgi:hypothetical protein